MSQSNTTDTDIDTDTDAETNRTTDDSIDIDAERTNVVPLDRDVIDLLARRRREAGSRPAYWSDSLDADRIGVAGEAAVALRYDLPSPTHTDVTGDGGVDFAVEHAGRVERWDVKATRHADPSLMVPREYVGPADAYLLVTVHETDDGSLFGILVGFARAERAIRPETLEESKGGGVHHELPTDALGPVPETDAVVAIDRDHPDHPAAHREGVPPGSTPTAPEVIR